jgi:hypothetical protein
MLVDGLPIISEGSGGSSQAMIGPDIPSSVRSTMDKIRVNGQGNSSRHSACLTVIAA